MYVRITDTVIHFENQACFLNTIIRWRYIHTNFCFSQEVSFHCNLTLFYSSVILIKLRQVGKNYRDGLPSLWVLGPVKWFYFLQLVYYGKP